jgi:hypothetical protein
MPPETHPTISVREIENAWIPLKDGTRLAARLWLPDDAERNPVPAVFEYVPYRKRDGTAQRDALVHPYFAARGFACVRVDIRGSGESDGVLTDEYLPLEQDDAIEVIDWIARQPWCTGAVGMMGNSWGGFNALQVAARRPAPLKAIITSCSTDDRYADDIHFMGGCLLNDNLKWASTMFAHNSRPPDPALVGDRWRGLWRQRLEGSGLWIDTWLRHQRRDAFWKHGSVCEDFSRIQIPVFSVSGWADGYKNAIPRLLRGLAVPQLAWIGQWAHKYPHMATPGPAVGFLQEATRWWEQWLCGRDTGIMQGPLLRAYIQEPVPPRSYHATIAGRWVGEAAWPSPHIERRRFYLNASGLAAQAGRETALRICSPQTVGLHAGRWCAYGTGPDLPSDQRADDAGSLVFDSEPLERRIEILGAPTVELELAADRPIAMVAVRLGAVAPDGAVTRVTYGLLNLTHRESHEQPAPLEAGRRYRVVVTLNDVGQAFLPGQRIRVAISTCYWPIAWPSPEAVTLTVFAGASHVELPVREARKEDAALPPLPPAELPPALPVTMLAPVRESRKITHDLWTDETHVEVSDDQGTKRFDGIGLAMRSRQDQRYSIRADDPLSARTEIAWTVAMSRGDWSIETRTHSVMTATRSHFRVQARLDAFEGDARVFSRNWMSEIPRDLV